MDRVTMRRNLIVEGNPDGHRLYYASLLAAAAKQSGEIVHIATTELAISSPEWTLHMGNLGAEVPLEILKDYSTESIGRLCNEIEADHVVVPDGDAFAFELAKGKRWPGRGNVTALVMREKGQPSRIPGFSALKTVAKGLLLGLASMRPRVKIRLLKSSSWRGYSILPTTRDPVTFSLVDTAVDREDGRFLPVGGFWFGVLGSVGHRKNFPLVAEAVASLECANVGLAIAGRIEEGILQQAKPHLDQILASGGRIEIVDRLLADAELDQIISELDCIVLAHSNEGPSGILGKAVAAGTNIVAAGALTLRSDCRHIGASAEWVQLRGDHLADAFARTMRKPRPRPELLASPAEFASDLLGLRP